jgi:dTDP-4-amino-4,6-dideoxygalactose transaminase
MGRLQTVIERRRALAALYDAALADIEWLRPPATAMRDEQVYQSYVVLLDERVDRSYVMRSLREQGIESTIGTYACHAQPFFRERFGYAPGDIPNSYLAFSCSLALPLHSRMVEQDVVTVVRALRRSVP